MPMLKPLPMNGAAACNVDISGPFWFADCEPVDGLACAPSSMSNKPAISYALRGQRHFTGARNNVCSRW